MRITGGQSKGRLLTSFKGMNIRPTPDKVREAIFNIIGQNLSGFYVLDLFAGTGSLGIEALSRGAKKAVFIDISRQSVNIINKNLELCVFKHSGKVVRSNLRKGIPISEFSEKIFFNLVFIDPPYGKNLLPLLLDDLLLKGILYPGSRVVAESSKIEVLPISFGKISMSDIRTYGDTKITIYENRYK